MRGRENRLDRVVATHVLSSLPETMLAKEAKTLIFSAVENT
jgi:hypothetical protein